MLVLCGRADGLVASITRLIHFGPLTDELRRKRSPALLSMRPSSAARGPKPASSTFSGPQWMLTGGRLPWRVAAAPSGWRRRLSGARVRRHVRLHRGRLCGAGLRVEPTIAGFKCEDTILIGASANEVLTETPGWPLVEVTSLGAPGDAQQSWKCRVDKCPLRVYNSLKTDPAWAIRGLSSLFLGAVALVAAGARLFLRLPRCHRFAHPFS